MLVVTAKSLVVILQASKACEYLPLVLHHLTSSLSRSGLLQWQQSGVNGSDGKSNGRDEKSDGKYYILSFGCSSAWLS